MSATDQTAVSRVQQSTAGYWFIRDPITITATPHRKYHTVNRRELIHFWFSKKKCVNSNAEKHAWSSTGLANKALESSG